MITPPKLYVNGFPKSGLHLAIRMTLPLFEVANETIWFSTNPWTTGRGNIDKVVDKFSEIQSGTLLMGHTGYLRTLEKLFHGLQIYMMFVYRDLRDVAVSQTYHILDDQNGNLHHPGRKDYSKDKDEVLMAVIRGIPRWAGVVERWKTFEPWLKFPFVFPVRFEDLIKKPEMCAKRFFKWVYEIALKGQEPSIDKELQLFIQGLMAVQLRQKDSNTFRKGKVGSWKREFKPEHVQAFKESDKNQALLKLGYVKREDW